VHKPTEEDVSLFRTRALAVMRRFGVRHTKGDPNHFVLDTRVEALTLIIGEETIQGTFTNPLRAKVRMVSDQRLNETTGSWDWNAGRDDIFRFEYHIDDLVSNIPQH
jgi:hypothetical protein